MTEIFILCPPGMLKSRDRSRSRDVSRPIFDDLGVEASGLGLSLGLQACGIGLGLEGSGLGLDVMLSSGLQPLCVVAVRAVWWTTSVYVCHVT